MKRKMIALLLAASMMAGLLTGCGGSEGENTTDETTVSTTNSGVGEESNTSSDETETHYESLEEATTAVLSGAVGETDVEGEALASDDEKEEEKRVWDEVPEEGTTDYYLYLIDTYEAPEEDLVINEAVSFYYYNQLDAVSSDFYDAIEELMQDPSENHCVACPISMDDPDSETLHDAFNLAYSAYHFDHPEAFCLVDDTVRLGYSYTEKDGGYNTYVYVREASDTYEEELRAFNDAADQILSQIDTSQSQTEIARQVHDILIDLITYDTATQAAGSDTIDKAHTAYGALVENSSGNANYAVCDGYTMAYEYLLQQLGFEVTVLVGYAGTEGETLGAHAWSIVNMDGEWKEVDVTWDDAGGKEESLKDSGVEEYAIEEALADEAYMDKVTHAYFALSTENMNNFTAGDEYNYTTSDGRWTLWIIGGNSQHQRSSGYEEYHGNQGYLIDTAPIAY